MIIKASQRGFAGELARHLLNTNDNEQVTVHALEGFSCETLPDALHEIEAISQGTRCKQPLFHVSFNPPPEANVSTRDFEKAIKAAGKKLGLENQPHAVIFHEKNGRHAHCVFSRIDADSMTAINLPYFKNKMMALSKELYLTHGWKMPQGFLDKSLRNPLNYSLQEWQQAKRTGQDPRMIKKALQGAWHTSKNKQEFEEKIQKYGFYLARGDRRGFVIVDYHGEVYSLSRQLGIKAAEISKRLGDKDKLRTVKQAKARIDQKKVHKLTQLQQKIERKHATKLNHLNDVKQQLKAQHQGARHALKKRQQRRNTQEQQKRQQRFNTGLRGFWDKLIGRENRIAKQNQRETYAAHRRDQRERDALIFKQLQEQYALNEALKKTKEHVQEEKLSLQRAMFGDLPKDVLQQYEHAKDISKSGPKLKPDFDMSL